MARVTPISGKDAWDFTRSGTELSEERSKTRPDADSSVQENLLVQSGSIRRVADLLSDPCRNLISEIIEGHSAVKHLRNRAPGLPTLDSKLTWASRRSGLARSSSSPASHFHRHLQFEALRL